MAKKADLIKDLDYLSEKVSERTRVMALAIIAIWWGALVGKETMNGFSPNVMTGPLCLAALSILSDFMQYSMIYLANRRLLHNLEREKLDEFSYDTKSIPYKLRNLLFYLKQIFMAVGLAWFIVRVSILVFY